MRKDTIMPFDKYTAEIQDWGTAIEIVAEIPERGRRRDSLEVSDGTRFLVAVISTPEGLKFPWIDAEMTLEQPSGAHGPRDVNNDAVFADPEGKLVIIHDPPLGTWNLEIASNGQMPFAVQFTPYLATPNLPPPNVVGFKCKACKTIAKALAVAIVAAVTLATIPQALILAVAKFLGVSAVAAGAFINAVIGDAVDVIAEKLCKRIGLC
jgi:hypothetical protein